MCEVVQVCVSVRVCVCVYVCVFADISNTNAVKTVSVPLLLGHYVCYVGRRVPVSRFCGI